MVDLHQGLLVKIYTSVARADQKWSGVERELARELVDHLWQQRLAGAELQRSPTAYSCDAGRLQWYSLLRPFDRIAKIRNFVPELETVVLRVANLVAKADGTVSAQEADAIRAIHDGDPSPSLPYPARRIRTHRFAGRHLLRDSDRPPVSRRC